MAKTSGGRSSSSNSRASTTKPKTTTEKQAAAGKSAITEEFKRKKDELLKLKSLDIFLIKNAMGTNPKKSDMKPELKEIVKRLKAKKTKTLE